MATVDDVRRIASALPEAIEAPDGLVFSVMVKGKRKGFIWSWSERVHPKRPKVVNEGVLAARVRNLEIKSILLAEGGERIFTEPHYDGYPAVLIRLEAIDVNELEDLIVEAWRTKAPKELVDAFDRQP